MRSGIRFLSLAGLMAGFLLFAGMPASAQEKKKQKHDDVSFITTDGLRLFGNWYIGGKGRGSDTVLMLPNYKSEFSKGEWNTLAEELQKEGFSVLVFDFRGHGKSKSVKTFDNMKLFNDTYANPWNKLAGVPTGLTSPPKGGIDVARFRPAIFPYLVNDIAAARKFLDAKNDAGECNVGHFHIIGDRESCGLAMAWMGTEFQRVAVYQKTAFDLQPSNHFGSRDLVSAVWLSPQPLGGSTLTLINNLVQSDPTARDVIRDKVSMAFVCGDGDTASIAQARQWFSKWGIPANAKDDPKIGKYLVEVKGGKTLAGINLVDPSKGLDTMKQIVEFLKATQKKNLSGTEYLSRNVNSEPPIKVPLANFGIKDP